MALELKHRICVSCDTIQFIDQTRPYSLPGNATGYGAPNPDFGELVPYTVAITIPGGTEPIYTLDLLADPPAPNADGDYVWEIGAGVLGLEYILSGNYTFYVVAGDDDNVIGGTPLTYTLYPTLYGDILKRATENVVTTWQNCKDTKKKREAMDMYDSVKAGMFAACCGYEQITASLFEAAYLSLKKCC